DVRVVHDPAEGPDSGDGRPKHFDRVASAISLVRVGEHFADVPGAGSAEDRVRERVRDRVAIRVPDETDITRNPAAAQDHLGAGSEAGRVVTYPDSKRGSRGRTGNREPGTGNRLSGIGNREWGMGTSRTAFDSRFPIP